MLLNCGVGEDCESPLDCMEIEPVHPKGNQSWIFFGSTDAEVTSIPESLGLGSPDVKNWLTRKDPDAGKDWRLEEKGTTEDKMVGWHHQLDGNEFGSWWWTGKPGVLQSMGSQRVGHDWATELNWKYEPEETLVIGHMPIALVEQNTLNCREKIRKKSGIKSEYICYVSLCNKLSLRCLVA